MRVALSDMVQEDVMDDRKKPNEDEAIDEKAQESRDDLEKIPPPGTDPLHEGP